MLEQRVSLRYARAIFDTALTEGVLDLIRQDFINVGKVLKESDELRSIIANPVFQGWRKKQLFNTVFERVGVSKLSATFLILLIDKRRGNLIQSIIAQYDNLYNKFNNRQPVTIYSAVELSDEIQQQIVQRLTSWTQKTILPDYIVDKNLKGGFLIKVDDWVYDASIKNKLERLLKQLSSN